MAKASSTDKAAAQSTLKFETALSELEQIIRTMETGSLSLEDSLEAYRRGSELLKHCQGQLSEAERKVRVLEDTLLKDFDPGTGETR